MRVLNTYEVLEQQQIIVFNINITQTSHTSNGISTLKNQYFSPQNTLIRLYLPDSLHLAYISGDVE